MAASGVVVGAAELAAAGAEDAGLGALDGDGAAFDAPVPIALDTPSQTGGPGMT